MRTHPYYSARINNKKITITFENLKLLFKHTYTYFLDKGYFQEYLGDECVDSGFTAGLHGDNDEINSYLMLETGKNHLWPLFNNIDKYSEEDLFDMIEFLYDSLSKPEEGHFHPYDNSWHYHKFSKNRAPAQSEYRDKINKILLKYKDGYELNESGCILYSIKSEYKVLVNKELPIKDKENIEDRIALAISKFRSRDLKERREAVRYLGDVLEYLRPEIKKVIKKDDEDSLFNILNNFNIRHHNQRQKKDYDENIFLSWMFYTFLASIHAIVHFINKYDKSINLTSV